MAKSGSPTKWEYSKDMRKAHIDLLKMKDQIELIDMLSDCASEEDAELLDGVAGFLDSIVTGNVVCFMKEHDGKIE